MKTTSRTVNYIKIIYSEDGQFSFYLPEIMTKEKYMLWKKENKEEIEIAKNEMKKEILETK